MDTSAKGLRVLITAGGAGIGRVMAQTFVDHGAKLHVCDVDEKALQQLPKQITYTLADVSKLADVDSGAQIRGRGAEDVASGKR